MMDGTLRQNMFVKGLFLKDRRFLMPTAYSFKHAKNLNDGWVGRAAFRLSPPSFSWSNVKAIWICQGRRRQNWQTGIGMTCTA